MSGCVIGYVRVSTTEQVQSGAGLDAQRTAIDQYAKRAGLVVERWISDEGVSGSLEPEARRGMAEALETLARCKAGILLVAKLDRLSRKATHVHQFLDLAEKQGWAVAAADGSVDMTSPYGRATTGVAGVFAQLERDLIRARTREALAERKAKGVRLGRRTNVPPEIRERIADERAEGRTLTAIADGLTGDGIPTVGNGAAREGSVSKRGARWYASTVSAVLRSIELDAEAEAARKASAPPDR